MADQLAPAVSADEAEPATPAAGDPPKERDYEAEARAMGWRPKDEWTGDPEKHRDAQTFVELADNDPASLRQKYAAKVKEVEEFQRRTAAATKAEIERAAKAAEDRYNAELDRLKTERERLIEQYAGDPASINKINQNFEAAKEGLPDPKIAAEIVSVRENWIAQRPAYQTDKLFHVAAKTAMEEVIAQEDPNAWRTMTATELQTQRFAKVDQILRDSKRFTDVYGEPKPEKISANGAPPADARTIEQPSRSSSPSSKSFDALPAEAKQMFKMLEADGIKIKKDDFAKDYYNG
jgi:hypothetical protein